MNLSQDYSILSRPIPKVLCTKSTGMEISLNQQAQTVADNCSLQQLIQTLLPQHQKGIAVAVNNAVVPKLYWEEHLLRPNDTVTIIRATQGG